MELTVRDVSVVVAGDTTGEAFTECKTVSLPFLINSKAIQQGQNLILLHAFAKAEPRPKKGRTWVDEVSEMEEKRMRQQGQKGIA